MENPGFCSLLFAATMAVTLTDRLLPDWTMALCNMLLIGATETTATAGRTGEEEPGTVAEMAATASTTGVPAPEGKSTSSRIVFCPLDRITLLIGQDEVSRPLKTVSEPSGGPRASRHRKWWL